MRRVRATPTPAFAAFAFGALLAGCGPNADEEAPAVGGTSNAVGATSAGPRVVLGTGREAFEALASDGTIPLIKGIQGGFHVWTSFLAYGFHSDVLRMELTTRWDELDDSVLEMAGNVAVRPATDADGMPAQASLGWPASIFNPACANGRRLGIELTVRDTEMGLAASDSRRWIVDVAAEDRSSDCAQ
jgi:hypothetical protein